MFEQGLARRHCDCNQLITGGTTAWNDTRNNFCRQKVDKRSHEVFPGCKIGINRRRRHADFRAKPPGCERINPLGVNNPNRSFNKFFPRVLSPPSHELRG
jgi:hypothetical protein